MSKLLDEAVKELTNMAKSQTENEDAKSGLVKAFENLAKAGKRLAKGIDLDAKDYGSSDIDHYDDGAPRRTSPRQVADHGSGYSGMHRTPREDEEWEEDNSHRVIATGQPEVHGGHAEAPMWEEPEEPELGDEEHNEHTRPGKKVGQWREKTYANKSFKDMKKKEHEKEECDDEESEKSLGESYVYDQLLESPEFAEIVESTPVVEHIANVMGKSFAVLAEDLHYLRKSLDSMYKAQVDMYKSLAGAPTSTPAPGVMGVFDGKTAPLNIPFPGMNNVQPQMVKGNSAASSAEGKAWHSDALRSLETAAQNEDISGELFLKVATQLDSLGKDALKSIPANVRKQYNLE